MFLHVTQLSERSITIWTFIRFRIRMNIHVVYVRGKFFRFLTAILTRVFILVAVDQHMLYQTAFRSEAFSALRTGVRTLIRVYQQMIFIYARVLTHEVTKSALDSVPSFVLRLMKQNRYLGRAFNVRIANIAEEAFDRLEDFRLVLLLIDNLTNVIVVVEFRLVRESAVTAITSEIFLVLQKFMLRVRT